MSTPFPPSIVARATGTSSASPTCVSATPDKNGYVPPSACDSLYAYYPSFAAAIIFSILFGAATIFHAYQAYALRKKFCWVIIMGAAWEAGSFITRTVSTRHQQEESLATVSQLLVLLAPLWINAFDYMILGRMVYFYIPEKKLFGIKATSFSKWFVWLDVLSFLVQAAGGMMLTGNGKSHSTIMLGIHVYMGGIGMQELFVLCFIGMCIGFHRRLLVLERQSVFTPKKWKILLYTLYVSLALITIRIIYRLVEYSAGTDESNPLPYHEAYFYALEALPMAIAVWIVGIVHPGYSLVGPDSEFPKLTRSEKKELKRAKKEAKKERKFSRHHDPESGDHIELVPDSNMYTYVPSERVPEPYYAYGPMGGTQGQH